MKWQFQVAIVAVAIGIVIIAGILIVSNSKSESGRPAPSGTAIDQSQPTPSTQEGVELRRLRDENAELRAALSAATKPSAPAIAAATFPSTPTEAELRSFAERFAGAMKLEGDKAAAEELKKQSEQLEYSESVQDVDMKRTESLLSPLVVTITILESESGQGAYRFARSNVYSLEFSYDSGKWKPLRGTRTCESDFWGGPEADGKSDVGKTTSVAIQWMIMLMGEMK